MKTELLERLLNEYSKDLVEQTSAVLITDTDKYEEILNKTHLTWFEKRNLAYTMITKILIRLAVDTPLSPKEEGKMNRWLGFIQGLMSELNLRTINQMRDESRPVFK